MRGRTHVYFIFPSSLRHKCLAFPGQAGGAEHCPVTQPGLGDPALQLGAQTSTGDQWELLTWHYPQPHSSGEGRTDIYWTTTEYRRACFVLFLCVKGKEKKEKKSLSDSRHSKFGICPVVYCMHLSHFCARALGCCFPPPEDLILFLNSFKILAVVTQQWFIQLNSYIKSVFLSICSVSDLLDVT